MWIIAGSLQVEALAILYAVNEVSRMRCQRVIPETDASYVEADEKYMQIWEARDVQQHLDQLIISSKVVQLLQEGLTSIYHLSWELDTKSIWPKGEHHWISIQQEHLCINDTSIIDKKIQPGTRVVVPTFLLSVEKNRKRGCGRDVHVEGMESDSWSVALLVIRRESFRHLPLPPTGWRQGWARAWSLIGSMAS
jgi:hypothetical protein